MGSVKDLKILKKPAENSLGVVRFVFSDRYSVFDWGEMPDPFTCFLHKISFLSIVTVRNVVWLFP